MPIFINILEQLSNTQYTCFAGKPSGITITHSGGGINMPKYDAVVIGAGNGGLAAACKMALEGKKTLLIEKHNLPGGCASSFRRGRFEFETALHELCEWGDDKHLVIMPATAREIVQEGIDQAHCVGNYTERVARSESVILFVRRKDKPNEAWYTMEIKPDMKKLNSVQCRGYENKDRSPEDAEEISKVKRKYQAWFNRRPTNGFEGQILTKYYKAVRKVKGKYISNHDGKTEYKLGEVLSMKTDQNPDNVAVEGIHVASLGFAQNFGNYWPDVAILELEVNIHDVVVPNALDQVRASKVRVIREVPFSEMGVWGETHARKASA
jgi:hypothetical protein